jgi:hypothetical protein
MLQMLLGAGLGHPQADLEKDFSGGNPSIHLNFFETFPFKYEITTLEFIILMDTTAPTQLYMGPPLGPPSSKTVIEERRKFKIHHNFINFTLLYI